MLRVINIELHSGATIWICFLGCLFHQTQRLFQVVCSNSQIRNGLLVEQAMHTREVPVSPKLIAFAICFSFDFSNVPDKSIYRGR